VLEAQGAWRVAPVPHNLKLHQQILREPGKRHRTANLDPNPIEAYVEKKQIQAKKTRNAAAELAHATRVLASAPTVRTPVGPRPAFDSPFSLNVALPEFGSVPWLPLSTGTQRPHYNVRAPRER
jgi:hypothetical protein